MPYFAQIHPIYEAMEGAADHLPNKIIKLIILDYTKIKTNKLS